MFSDSSTFSDSGVSDDSGVAFLSHRLILFQPRHLLSSPFRITESLLSQVIQKNTLGQPQQL